MMRSKMIAAALAVFTVLTLAVSSASADGGGGGCKKDCPPPPCKVDCPNPEPTEPPVPPPPPDRDQICSDHESLRIPERHHSPKFVRVAVSIDGVDGERFVVEYQRNRESSQARTLDGGELDGTYASGFTVRAWRDLDALVRVRVWDANCDNPIPNITLAIV